MADKFNGSLSLDEFLSKFRYGQQPYYDHKGTRLFREHELTEACIRQLKDLRSRGKIS